MLHRKVQFVVKNEIFIKLSQKVLSYAYMAFSKWNVDLVCEKYTILLLQLSGQICKYFVQLTGRFRTDIAKCQKVVFHLDMYKTLILIIFINFFMNCSLGAPTYSCIFWFDFNVCIDILKFSSIPALYKLKHKR